MNIAYIRCLIVLAFAGSLSSCCSRGSNGSDGLANWLFGCTTHSGTVNASSGLWQGAQLIGGNSAGDATNPQIAENASGDAMSAWQQSDGVRKSIWANLYSAGNGWGTAAVIETNNAGDATNPQVAIDTAGDSLAVWQQSNGLRDNIWANRYTAGSGWGTAELIEANNAGDATNPQIAVDSVGDALVVWQQSDGLHNSIWANRFTPSGGWGIARQIENNSSGDATNPQIAVDPAGNALAVWQQSDGVRDNIWANGFTANGGWGIARLIQSINGANAANPQVAVDSAGDGLAVWQQSDGTRDNIWANRFTAGGDWGTARVIESNSSGNATNPEIAVDSAGDGLAVWQQLGGAYNTIFAASYSTVGGWNSALLIGTSITGDALLPQVAIGGNGSGLAVWYQLNGAKYNIASNLFK